MRKTMQRLYKKAKNQHLTSKVEASSMSKKNRKTFKMCQNKNQNLGIQLLHFLIETRKPLFRKLRRCTKAVGKSGVSQVQQKQREK